MEGKSTVRLTHSRSHSRALTRDNLPRNSAHIRKRTISDVCLPLPWRQVEAALESPHVRGSPSIFREHASIFVPPPELWATRAQEKDQDQGQGQASELIAALEQACSELAKSSTSAESEPGASRAGGDASGLHRELRGEQNPTIAASGRSRTDAHAGEDQHWISLETSRNIFGVLPATTREGRGIDETAPDFKSASESTSSHFHGQPRMNGATTQLPRTFDAVTGLPLAPPYAPVAWSQEIGGLALKSPAAKISAVPVTTERSVVAMAIVLVALWLAGVWLFRAFGLRVRPLMRQFKTPRDA